MKPRSNSKNYKTQNLTKNEMISFNLTEPNFTENKKIIRRQNQQSGNNRKSNFILPNGKQINVSTLNINEEETSSKFSSKHSVVTIDKRIQKDQHMFHNYQNNNKQREEKTKTLKLRVTPSTERILIIKEQNKSKLVDRQLQEKKNKIEVENLIREQTKLKKNLEMTKDQMELNLISKKILIINQRINKLMNEIKLRSKEENQVEIENENENAKGSKKDNLIFKENLSIIRKNEKSKTSSLKLITDLERLKNPIYVKNKKSNMNDENTTLNVKKYSSKSNKYSLKKFPIKNTKTLLIEDDLLPEVDYFPTDINLEEREKYKKTIEDSLKIEELLLQTKLLEQKKKFSKNQKVNYANAVKYPNFFFLRQDKREEDKNSYIPSTNISSSFNLFMKSYRPEGFRTRQKKKNSEKSNVFNNYINSFSTEPLAIPNTKRNVQDIIEENDENNLLLNNKQIIEVIRKKKVKPRTAFLTSIKNKERSNSNVSQRLRPNSASMILSSNASKTFSLHSEIKNLKKIYAQVINDHKIIRNGVTSHYKLKKRKYKASDYDNLLKLWEMNQLKDNIKKIKNRRDHEQKKKDNLKTFTGSNRKFLYDVYLQMDYENRILNKLNGCESNPDEEKIRQLKMHKEFKRIARETMYLKKEKIEDQDKELKKQFEHHYSNLDQLQWLIKKEKVFKNIKPRFLNRVTD